MPDQFYILFRDRGNSWNLYKREGETIKQVVRELPDEILAHDEFSVIRSEQSITKKQLVRSGDYDDVIPEHEHTNQRQ